jgi:hypothetical protein
MIDDAKHLQKVEIKVGGQVIESYGPVLLQSMSSRIEFNPHMFKDRVKLPIKLYPTPFLRIEVIAHTSLPVEFSLRPKATSIDFLDLKTNITEPTLNYLYRIEPATTSVLEIPNRVRYARITVPEHVKITLPSTITWLNSIGDWRRLNTNTYELGSLTSLDLTNLSPEQLYQQRADDFQVSFELDSTISLDQFVDQNIECEMIVDNFQLYWSGMCIYKFTSKQ